MDTRSGRTHRLRQALIVAVTVAATIAPASFLVPSCGAPSSGQPKAPQATPVR